MVKGAGVKRSKLHYATDGRNLLSFRDDGSPLKANGIFKVDGHNRLVYWLNEQVAWRRKYGLPGKIVFEGALSLDENHDLRLVLKDSPWQHGGERVSIKGEIVSSGPDSFLFQINTVDKEGLSHISLLRFGGKWLSDEFNRITFTLTRTSDPSVLTLQGVWQLDRNQQVTYEYQKSDLRTKQRKICRLAFEGYWQINVANRLTYIFEGNSESFFDFRVSLQSPNLYPQKGVIKYRIGVGLAKERAGADRMITLAGAWKFDRGLGVSFEMFLSKGRVRAMSFDTRLSLAGKNEILFSLLSEKREPLGLQIRCTHRFLKDSRANSFLRLKKNAREALIEAGVSILF